MKDIDKSKQQLIEEVAALRRQMAECNQTAAKLQASEARYRALVDSADDIIFTIDRAGRYTSFNQSALRRFGLKWEDLVGKSIGDFTTPQEAAFYEAQHRRVFETGEIVRFERFLANQVGEHWYSIVLSPIFGPTGQVIAISAISRIVTERKQTEQERERLLAAEREQRLLAETLGDVFLALTAQTNHEAVLDEILRQMQRIVAHSAANIVLLEDNTLRIVRWQGYQPFGSEGLLSSLEQPLTDFPLDAWVVQTRRPLLVTDTQQTPDWVVVAESAWIRSSVAVPICLQERVLGLLRLDNDMPHKFSARDIERLQPLANAAAIALENARLYDQARQELAERRQAEQAVLELNRKLLALQHAGATIASSLDLAYVLNTVTREMVNLLAVESCAIYEWHQPTNTVSAMVKYGPSGWWDGDPLSIVYNLRKIPLTERVLLERQAEQMMIRSAALEPDVLAYMQAGSIKTLLMLPMEFQDRIVGLVEVIDNRVERSFGLDEIALAQFLANQAAIAIENARLYHQARQEIAERKQVEQELRQVATRNQAILDAIPDSMFYFSRDGQLLDYKIADDDSLSQEVLDQTRHYLEQPLASGRMQVVEYQLSSRFGQQDYEARLIVSGPGEVLAIIRNITERKQAERQAIQTERLAALGRLAATLAHEINNPLQAIQSHLDLILDFPLEPGESEQYLQIIRRQIERLRDIAQGVLNYAHPKPVPRQPIFLTELVQQVLSLARKALERRRIQVTTDWCDVAPVLAASNQLTQVFLNLVINATEALTEDGQLHIAIYPEGDKVAVSFTNNGPIIPEEILLRIFEPFFTTKPDGSGLGLWVSHSLVQQHNGLLTVENLSDQRGVIFTVKLPTTPDSALS